MHTPGLFQDADFAGDLKDAKSTLGGMLCILGGHTFFRISRGPELEGILALNFGDMVVDVLGPLAGSDPMHNIKLQKAKSLVTDKRLTESIDYVLPNTHISSQRASLFCF